MLRRGRLTRTALAAVGLPIAVVAACFRERGIPAPVSIGVALPWTLESCRAPVRDRDADGLDDDCEFSLAQALAPELIVDPRDCIWIADDGPPRLGGGYLFAVQGAPHRAGIRIAYLPAYFRDCGWEGLVCLTRGRGCAAHDGDSELIVVQTRYDNAAGRWVTDAVFLSAHCFGRSAGRCRWYEGDELRRFEWAGATARGAPRVWIARGKHGNYPTRRSCDAGHWSYDSCDDNSVAYRFPVISGIQNVGSRLRPLPDSVDRIPRGCMDAGRLPWGSPAVDPGTHECFWNPGRPFRGWQRTRRGEAPTAYARVLQRAAQF